MITVPCAARCGRNVQTYPSRLKAGRGKYCSRECSDAVTLIKKGQHLSPATEIKKGQKPWSATGWRYHQSRRGGKRYKQIFLPEHPYATKNGYVMEHRLVIEKLIGRYLDPGEVVDHINGNTLDNRPENLRHMPKKDHDRMNTPLNIHRRWQKGASP